MNPAPAIAPVGPARIGQRPDQGRRRDTQDQFRRALDQREGGGEPQRETGPETPAPARPMATALQRQALPSRQEPTPQARHVDVIA